MFEFYYIKQKGFQGTARVSMWKMEAVMYRIKSSYFKKYIILVVDSNYGIL